MMQNKIIFKNIYMSKGIIIEFPFVHLCLFIYLTIFQAFHIVK